MGCRWSDLMRKYQGNWIVLDINIVDAHPAGELLQLCRSISPQMHP